MCRYLPTAQKWMRGLLLQQCRLLPQIAPSLVDWETTVLLTQRSCKQFCLLLNKPINFKKRNSWFFADSLSALQALGKIKTDHSLLIQIQELLDKINADQKEIVLMRVPGHVGIRGDEAADTAAKEALDKKPTADLVTFFGPKTFYTHSTALHRQPVFCRRHSAVQFLPSWSNRCLSQKHAGLHLRCKDMDNSQ